MFRTRVRTRFTVAAVASAVLVACSLTVIAADAPALLEQLGVDKGIAAVVGLPDGGGPQTVVDLAAESELTVYFQSSDAEQVAAVREAAETAGLLGSRIFAARGDVTAIQLPDNLADAVLVFDRQPNDAVRR